MASISGRIFQIEKYEKGEVVELRYLVLSGRNIAMFANDPKEKPNEKPIRRGVAGLHQRTEDLGRKTYANGQVLHVFRLYNALDPTKEGLFGCSTAEASDRWIAAFQLAQEEAEKAERQARSRRVSADLESTSEKRSVYIPDESNVIPGFHRLVTFEKGISEDQSSFGGHVAGDDAKDTTNWTLFKVANGLRFFEDLNSSKIPISKNPKFQKSKISKFSFRFCSSGFEKDANFQDEEQAVVVRAVGTVEASPESIFELLMNTDRDLRSQWDPLTAETDIVEVVDGHNDIVYAKIHCKYLKQWQRDRDLVYSRFWRRDQDGSYSISQFAISHPNKPPVEGIVRISDSPGAWEILPLPTLKKGFPRTVVRHTLELTSSGWVNWRPTFFKDFEDTVPYVCLTRIAGIREFFAARTVPTAPVGFEENFISFRPVCSSMPSDMPSLTSRNVDLYHDGDDMEMFHDAISVPLEETEEAKSERRNMLQGRYRSLSFNEKLQPVSSEQSMDNDSFPPPRDLDFSAKKIKLRKLPGSLKECTTTGQQSCWTDPGADQFAVRGENYLNDRRKVSADKALLTLLAVDWFKSEGRIDEICARKNSIVQSKEGRSIPFILAINLQVPGNQHYSMVFYFASDRPILESSLLDKFANGNDNFRNQHLKLIPRVEVGYWAVKRAVGTKACLLGKAVHCRYLRQDNFLEIDCDIGASSVARGIIGVVLGYVTSLVVDLAILIEATTTEELPEYLLGTMRVNRLSLQEAIDPPS